MKHAKMQDEYIVILNEKELGIIQSALNNRMVYLQTFDFKEESWAKKCWEECFDLQIDFWHAGKD